MKITPEFCKNLNAKLLDLGLAPKQAEAGWVELANELIYANIESVPEDYTVHLYVEADLEQSLYIAYNGETIVSAKVDPNYLPLLNIDETPEQFALCAEMMGIKYDLTYEDGEEKARLEGLYNSKRDAVLAINPYVDCSISDPRAAEIYYDLHCDLYNSPPKGYISYAQMLKETERMQKVAAAQLDKAA